MHFPAQPKACSVSRWPWAGGKGLGAALWQLSHCSPMPFPSACVSLPCGFFPNPEARGPGPVPGHCSNLLCTGRSMRDEGGHSSTVYLYRTAKKKTSKDKLQNKFNLSDKNDIKELSP